MPETDSDTSILSGKEWLVFWGGFLKKKQQEATECQDKMSSDRGEEMVGARLDFCFVYRAQQHAASRGITSQLSPLSCWISEAFVESSLNSGDKPKWRPT